MRQCLATNGSLVFRNRSFTGIHKPAHRQHPPLGNQIHTIDQVSCSNIGRVERAAPWLTQPLSDRAPKRDAVRLAGSRPPSRRAVWAPTSCGHTARSAPTPAIFSDAGRQRGGSCARLGATGPAPLHHRAREAQMTNRLYSSWMSWGSGQGVNHVL